MFFVFVVWLFGLICEYIVLDCTMNLFAFRFFFTMWIFTLQKNHNSFFLFSPIVTLFYIQSNNEHSCLMIFGSWSLEQLKMLTDSKLDYLRMKWPDKTHRRKLKLLISKFQILSKMLAKCYMFYRTI